MNTTELAKYNAIPAPSNLDDLQRLAKLMVASGFFQNTKDLAQACVKIMAGQELGISPVASLQGIHFINNRVTYEAVILASALRRKGYRYKALKNDEKGSSIEFFDSGGESIGVSEFTAEHANTAGLAGKDTYKKFSRNMFWARAMANGARWYCPDVFGGPVYVPEELGAEVDESGKPLRDDAGTVVTAAIESGQSDKARALNDRLKKPSEPVDELAMGGTYKAVAEPLFELEDDYNGRDEANQ